MIYFLQWVTPEYVLPSGVPELGSVVNYLQKGEVVRAAVPSGGSQLKVLLTLEGGQKVLFKPQWYVSFAIW